MLNWICVTSATIERDAMCYSNIYPPTSSSVSRIIASTSCERRWWSVGCLLKIVHHFALWNINSSNSAKHLTITLPWVLNIQLFIMTDLANRCTSVRSTRARGKKSVGLRQFSNWHVTLESCGSISWITKLKQNEDSKGKIAFLFWKSYWLQEKVQTSSSPVSRDPLLNSPHEHGYLRAIQQESSPFP